MNVAKTLGVVGLLGLAALAFAAAPPARGPVRLTAQQQQHVDGLMARASAAVSKKDFEEAARLCGQVAEYRAKHQGKQHWQAVDAALAAEEWRELAKVPVKARADALRVRGLNVEAVRLPSQGKYREAELKAREALALSQKALGEAHPQTATSYNELASCLQSLGKASDALPLHKKALAIRQKALGEDHPHTAISYGNLAYCLQSLGKADEALPLHKKALAIRQNALGEAHPDTATSYNNLAGCLKELGKASEALPLHKKALAIRQKALGEAHPHTANCYNNLAGCLKDLGKASDALPLHKKALAISEKALGEAHPDTATSYNNLAWCLESLGRSSEALPLLKKALALRRKVLPEGHPHTAASYNNLATCLQSLGRSSEALLLHKKALAIRQEALGEDHPQTAISYDNLAGCLQELGRASDALRLHKKSLAIRQKALGEAHPRTATSYLTLAWCLASLGKADEALPLYRKALAINEKALGEAHPDTAHSYNDLALCLYVLEKYDEAARAFRSAALGWEFGRLNAGESGFSRSPFKARFVHPRQGLAACLARQGKPADAWVQAESFLARGLLEDLDESKDGPDRQRLAQLEALNARLLPLLTSTDLTKSDRQRRDELLAERDKLQAEMARAAVKRSEARALSLPRVQKQIPADAALVLWLDVGPLGEPLACVVRARGEPAWVRLPGSGEKGKWTEQDWSLAGRALEALQKPGESRQRGRLLSDLHKQRLAPLQEHLKGVKRLLVVPTGRMAKVPVEALTDGYAVSYVPSGSVHARGMERHRALKGDSLFVLADPEFSAEAPPQPPASGVLLTAVVPGGAAEKAGLRPGDVLLRVGGSEVDSPDELAEALKRQPPLTVLAWRDGEQIKARLGGGKLGAAVDKRSARAAVRAWSKEQQRFAPRGGDWKALPGTRVEMELLKGLVPKHTTLSGKEASERRLEQMAEKGELKQFRLLLLATHGEASVVPEQSALISAQHRAPSLEENAEPRQAGKPELSNRLTVQAVLRTWELDADLVTLSACETGVGPDGGGEGMLGFAQALLQKGARSVLLSRWKVDDAATSLLVWRFHQNVLGKRPGLKAPLGRAEALSEAKGWLRGLGRGEAEKALAELTDSLPRGQRGQVGRLPDRRQPGPKQKGDRPFEPPYYWAAFVLIGDPD